MPWRQPLTAAVPSRVRTMVLSSSGICKPAISFVPSSDTTDAVSAVAVAPDDRHALSGSADRTLRLWDLATGQLLHSFTEHGGPITAVAICPDGRHGLSGSRDRTLRLWDLEERVCRAMVPLESAPLAIALGA